MAYIVTNETYVAAVAQAVVLQKYPDAWSLTNLHLNVNKIGNKFFNESLGHKNSLFMFLETSAPLYKFDKAWTHDYIQDLQNFMESGIITKNVQLATMFLNEGLKNLMWRAYDENVRQAELEKALKKEQAESLKTEHLLSSLRHEEEAKIERFEEQDRDAAIEARVILDDISEAENKNSEVGLQDASEEAAEDAEQQTTELAEEQAAEEQAEAKPQQVEAEQPMPAEPVRPEPQPMPEPQPAKKANSFVPKPINQSVLLLSLRRKHAAS
jgi:hypothetical protein